MVFLVSYDLNKPGKDYSDLYKTLKNADGWWHYLDSCWLLSTNNSIKYWNDKIKPHIDDNDSLLIVEITNNYTGWLTQKAWDWIKNHF